MNRVSLTPSGVIEIQVIGDQSATTVRAMGDEVIAHVRRLRQTGQPVLILDNLKQMGETTSAARSEVARLVHLIDFDRAAMVGDGSGMMRYGTNLMLQAIGRSNVHYFSSRDAALIWLGISEA